MSYHFWTEEELSLLIGGLKRYDFNWEEVQAKFFQNLSVAQLKNKFYSNKQFKQLANQPSTDYEKQQMRQLKQQNQQLKTQTQDNSDQQNQMQNNDLKDLINKLTELTK
ncbi:Myb-like_DNA-binding domain-containing protein [Hexamita inflata]|uniref:Myb-like DNA-binding domain-containing protein n=1 Tax=Hexamita inflata TaxID=28002 RepID=A0AA86TL85_9EUKA|nr:Myb-like DNA-binding domain-containing protein [Hexamita inflata]CAI9971913.1 Myb-like DNA-binding domain-containing protein [Hexamita inflata]